MKEAVAEETVLEGFSPAIEVAGSGVQVRRPFGSALFVRLGARLRAGDGRPVLPPARLAATALYEEPPGSGKGRVALVLGEGDLAVMPDPAWDSAGRRLQAWQVRLYPADLPAWLAARPVPDHWVEVAYGVHDLGGGRTAVLLKLPDEVPAAAGQHRAGDDEALAARLVLQTARLILRQLHGRRAMPDDPAWRAAIAEISTEVMMLVTESATEDPTQS